MAIGVDAIVLSMTNPDTGEYLTANVYTVDGVYEADGVTLRRLSAGQLVMAICLQRASQLESGYDNPVTGRHVDGIVDLMRTMELTSEQLECMTKIENDVLASSFKLSSKSLVYNGTTYTYEDFLDDVIGMQDLPTGEVNAQSSEFLTALEAKMDEKNSFSQKTMIELQSLTNKRDQSYDMISNVLKSLNVTLTGIANNI